MEVESAKDRVTTHQPNESALKMDGASACYPYLTAPLELIAERVGWRGGCDEALGVIPGRTTSSADLGGTSKYSNETL